MLDFSDKPYHYFPPRPLPGVAWALRQFNRFWRLPSKEKIDAVRVEGLDELAKRRPDDRLVVLPNHPTHADASIMLEAVRKAKLRVSIMAAYDVFLRGKLDAFVMQSLGAFSVDREGSDSRSMKQAIATLDRGKRALVIFPEGNVYLENDRVAPFNAGAAFLALKAAGQLPSSRVVVVPVSIKASYVEDVRPVVAARLAALAKQLDVAIPEAATPLEALRVVGVAALARNLKHRGVEPPAAEDHPTLKSMIDEAAGRVLDQLESQLELSPKPRDGVADRVRRARRVIHEVRTDPDRQVDHAAATGWADQAMLAFRIASYGGAYVASRPTVDRIAETTEKLEEDLYRRMVEPMGRRVAVVRFGPLLDLSPWAGQRKQRAAVQKITAEAEGRVLAGLDATNQGLGEAGGEVWDEKVVWPGG